MHIIRRHQLQPKLLRPRNQVPIHLRLLWNPVILQFQEKILRPQHLLKPINRLPRIPQPILMDRLRNLTRQAPRQRDQPLLVLNKNLLIDPRLVIIPLDMRIAHQLHQVLVTRQLRGRRSGARRDHRARADERERSRRANERLLRPQI